MKWEYKVIELNSEKIWGEPGIDQILGNENELETILRDLGDAEWEAISDSGRRIILKRLVESKSAESGVF